MTEKLRSHYVGRLKLLENLGATLDREVRAALDGLPHVDRIAFRVKEVERFLEKAAKINGGQPKYVDPLHEIEDQVGGRVLVYFRRDMEPVEERLRETFRTEEIAPKEPESPKQFDYESRHQVFLIPTHLVSAEWSTRDDLPIAFEMQVRTLFMHAWAEPQHDLGYKGEPQLPRDAERLSAWAAASAWGGDHAFEEVLTIIREGREAEVLHPDPDSQDGAI